MNTTYKNKKTGAVTAHTDSWILDKTPSHLKDCIDHDYLDQLSPADAKFLSDFDKSYYCGMNTDVSKDWDKDTKKECFDRNNANRRDIYNNSSRTWTMKPLEKCKENLAEGYGNLPRGKTNKKDDKNAV